MLLASDTPWAGAAVFACATLRDQIIWPNAASARTLRGGKLLTAALQDSGWLRFLRTDALAVQKQSRARLRRRRCVPQTYSFLGHVVGGLRGWKEVTLYLCLGIAAAHGVISYRCWVVVATRWSRIASSCNVSFWRTSCRAGG